MINTEHILKNVLDRLGIANYASYEFRTGKGVEGESRVDALYGRVVIEYERPGTFKRPAGFNHAKEQVWDILKNIVGFDLNPLAVLAARTNYLIALGKLIRYKREEIEIPVYFADSIL